MISAFIVNTFLISIAVVIHYEILRLLSIIIPKLRIKHRLRVIIGVFGIICAHITEVWMFGNRHVFHAQLWRFWKSSRKF